MKASINDMWKRYQYDFIFFLLDLVFVFVLLFYLQGPFYLGYDFIGITMIILIIGMLACIVLGWTQKGKKYKKIWKDWLLRIVEILNVLILCYWWLVWYLAR